MGQGEVTSLLDVVDDPDEVEFLKKLEYKNQKNNPEVDYYDEDDLADGVIGTIPNSKIKKFNNDGSPIEPEPDTEPEDETDDEEEQVEETPKKRHNRIAIAVLTSALVLLPSAGYYAITNSNSTSAPVTEFKAVLHKQSFKDTVPKHVVKMTYLNSNDAPAYIAFYGDGKWALSNKNDFGTKLNSTTDAKAVTHTGDAVANQLNLDGKNPKKQMSFSQLANMPGIKTTMRYQFSDDGSRVELSIKVIPTKDFKKYFPKDTVRKITSYDYVFANFQNTAKNKFDADMSTSFNENIDKTSHRVTLSIVQ